MVTNYLFIVRYLGYIHAMNFFDINNIAFTVFGIGVSYLELFGVIAGLLAVILSSMANLWSWPIGIINVILFFFLFFQSQLYPDMFLQIFYLVTNIVGWWRWANPRQGEEDKKLELRVSHMTKKQLIFSGSVGIGGTVILGMFASRLHEWFPYLFYLPSAAPFQDSFIMVFSILAQYYMMHKKIECWIMWLLVDILATYVYFNRELIFSSMLYFGFCGIAAFALWNWSREYKNYGTTAGV
jgi:nicotinamide mononucleotide transporter